jgi:hypothetical protein
MGWRETDPAFYRPESRPLQELTNEELQALFNLRASKIQLDPKGIWEDNRIVSCWSSMIKSLEALYDIMLEIQARYPKSEVSKDNGRGAYFQNLLPLNEEQYLRVAVLPNRTVYGLKELPPDLSGIDVAKDSRQRVRR